MNISTAAARAIGAVLAPSSDPKVQQFASALTSTASAAEALGHTEFDLSDLGHTASSLDDAARAELAAAIDAARSPTP